MLLPPSTMVVTPRVWATLAKLKNCSVSGEAPIRAGATALIAAIMAAISCNSPVGTPEASRRTPGALIAE